MPTGLLDIVESTTLVPEEITTRTQQIRTAVLNTSESIDGPNFSSIHPDDLQLLFTEYDRRFFGAQIEPTLGPAPLDFGLSRRMTSSGGKTVCYTDRSNGQRAFEISVSTTILFGCFDGGDHRPVSGSGIVCRDRLDALQRIMEHELIHLIEMLLWNQSSCGKPRFHSMTLRFFGHTENKHRLITPRETAVVKYGIRPGMRVRFRYDGVQHTGLVNRITKRATVLVEDRRGQRYSDGKLYSKFYVPVQVLEAVD